MIIRRQAAEQLRAQGELLREQGEVAHAERRQIIEQQEAEVLLDLNDTVWSIVEALEDLGQPAKSRSELSEEGRALALKPLAAKFDTVRQEYTTREVRANFMIRNHKIRHHVKALSVPFYYCMQAKSALAKAIVADDEYDATDDIREARRAPGSLIVAMFEVIEVAGQEHGRFRFGYPFFSAGDPSKGEVF